MNKLYQTLTTYNTLGMLLLALSTAGSLQAQPNQQTADNSVIEEIMVTARRKEERLQDVPISITTFDQSQLDRRNVINASDLALYTPGLTANTRFGADRTTFAIRGFTQETRTSASVGVFFAEVIAPRGGGAITAGDGAGPGSFFDLANVQVLKGPQGTLFGRNTTGGSVLLVPNKPSNEFEGYVQAGAGNYNLVSTQGVVNIPFSDAVRLRLGVDYQNRDGYLKNRDPDGEDRLGDVEYIAARLSLVVDINEDLENYTILSYSDSENNGYVSQVFDCNNSGLGGITYSACTDSIERQGDDFYAIHSPIPDSESTNKQLQLINTTTWQLSENLTLKNIISYNELESNLLSSVFGTGYDVPLIPTGTQQFYPVVTAPAPGMDSTSQKGYVEELQFQGVAFDGKLDWQAGLYYEKSEPDGDSGYQSISNLSCDLSTLGSDPNDFRCNDYFSAFIGPVFPGVVYRQTGSVEFTNQAVYAQGTLDLSEQFKLTLGLRYTDDEVTGEVTGRGWTFLPGSFTTGAPLSAPTGTVCTDPGADANCHTSLEESSDAVTGVLGLDYTPIDNLLIYTKYSRGYRQGMVNIAGITGYNTVGPEKVDTYEIGSKWSFDGFLSGNLNTAVFYNDFTDQQLQLGLLTTTNIGTTTLINAGESSIKGLEIDATLRLFQGFTLSTAYAYLETEVKQVDYPQSITYAASVSPSANEGDDLPYTPKHSVTMTAAYELPIPAQLGNLTASLTYVYTDEQYAFAKEKTNALVPSFEVFNFNLDWTDIAGIGLDASLFATNILEEEYWTFVSGTYDSLGYDGRTLGEPRMLGMKLRYNF